MSGPRLEKGIAAQSRQLVVDRKSYSEAVALLTEFANLSETACYCQSLDDETCLYCRAFNWFAKSLHRTEKPN